MNKKVYGDEILKINKVSIALNIILIAFCLVMSQIESEIDFSSLSNIFSTESSDEVTVSDLIGSYKYNKITTKYTVEAVMYNTQVMLDAEKRWQDTLHPKYEYIKVNNNPANFKWFGTLEKYCKINDLPIELMVCLYDLESEFDPKSVNPSSGAIGLGQMLPSTFRWMRKVVKDGSRLKDLKNPNINIRYTTKLMSINIKERKTLRKALYSYGGCVSKVNKRNYIKAINNRLHKYYGITLNDLERRVL